MESPGWKACVVPAVPPAMLVPGATRAVAALLAKMAWMDTGVVVAFPAGQARWVFLGVPELLERMGSLAFAAFLELPDLRELLGEEVVPDEGGPEVLTASQEAFCRQWQFRATKSFRFPRQMQLRLRAVYREMRCW